MDFVDSLIRKQAPQVQFIFENVMIKQTNVLTLLQLESMTFPK